MASNPKVQRRIIRLAGREFVRVGQAAERAGEGLARLKAIGEGLSAAGRRIAAEAEAGVDLGLNDRIASGCGRLADLLRSQTETATPRRTALTLVEILEDLRDDILQDARSLAVSADLGQRAALAKRADARDRTLAAMSLGGDAAFDLYEVAGHLRHELGLPPEPGGFEYPTLGGCGCKGGVDARVLRSPERGRALNPGGPELRGPLPAALRDGLEGFGRRMADYLVASGLLLTMTTLICDDLCAAAGTVDVAPVFKGSNSVNDGTNWVPTFTVTWVLCCNCSCLKLWARLEDTTFDVDYTAPGLVVNTRPKVVADNAATKAGKAEVQNYNATNFPPPPAGGGPAPAPPPFVPNPGVKPAFNAVTCPPKC